MPHISPTVTNETTDEEIRDYYPVCSSASALSDQLTETLQNALQHTDWYYFNNDNFNILFLWPHWYCANKYPVSFTLFQKQMLRLDKVFMTVGRTALVHTRCYYHTK